MFPSYCADLSPDFNGLLQATSVLMTKVFTDIALMQFLCESFFCETVEYTVFPV